MALPYRQAVPSIRAPLGLVKTSGMDAPQPAPQLWLALVLPALSLEALGVRAEERAAVAVLEGEDSQARICALTAGATRAGIRKGMTVQAVLSIASHAKLMQRNPAAEREQLHRLATWCERFTPTISVQEPDALLLEMRGSLHLFDGISTLRTRLQRAFQRDDRRALTAFAPTPRAALWLARSGNEAAIEYAQSLRSVLGRVPLTVLQWSDIWQESFARLGLATLADLLRLPREGLGRRFGPELLDELDKALGVKPDTVPLWTPPVTYQDQADLGFDTRQTGVLLPVIEALLMRLAEALQIRDAGLQSFEIRLCGYHGTNSVLAIGTRDIGRTLSHWMRLVRTQLESLRLTHAVKAVRIVAERFEPFTACSAELFSKTSQSTPNDLSGLIDTLRARLGWRGVAGLRMAATRRPERASRLVTPGKTKASLIEFPARPVWLLDPPKPLETKSAKPHHGHHGLVLEEGPERIECGGWLGWEIQRDYFVARDPRGSRLWIYRELSQPVQWYLQGYFA